MRRALAWLIRAATLVAACVLALGLLLLSLGGSVSPGTQWVRSLVAVGDVIAGPFHRIAGPLHVGGPLTDAALNWGLVALVYLLLGRLLARLVHPRPRRTPSEGEPV